MSRAAGAGAAARGAGQAEVDQLLAQRVAAAGPAATTTTPAFDPPAAAATPPGGSGGSSRGRSGGGPTRRRSSGRSAAGRGARRGAGFDAAAREASALSLTPPRRLTSRDASGFLGGLFLYVLALNFIRHGPDGVKGWLGAKFVNKPWVPPTAQSSNESITEPEEEQEA